MPAGNTGRVLGDTIHVLGSLLVFASVSASIGLGLLLARACMALTLFLLPDARDLATAPTE